MLDVTAQRIPSVLNKSEKPGLYYMVTSGQATWCCCAKYVFDVAKEPGFELQVETLSCIQVTQYPIPAKRKLNGRLNCSKIEESFGLSMPDWKVGVGRMMTEVLEEFELREGHEK